MRAVSLGGVGALLVLYAVVAPAPIFAQQYPTRPVRVITAGAGTFPDIVTRQMAQRLSEVWGQAIVVENQPAAGLTVGTAIASRANPDGYTLVMSDRSALAVAPNLYKNLPYNPAKDLAPITLVARAPLALAAHPSIPAGNLREFMDYARKRPGVINYASAGPGTAPHIAGELFKQLAGIDLVCVQYKGGGAAVIAVVGGESGLVFSSIATLSQHIQAGRLKAYAIASSTRFAGAPDIPAAPEAGLPGLEAEQWIGMLAPARTAVPLIARLNREINDVLRAPVIQATLMAQGAEPAPGTPHEFVTFMAKETIKLKKLMDQVGLRVE